MLCPICQVDLKITERQGVEIDYCPKCRGVWLDRGELDKLIERAAALESQSFSSAARRDYRDEYDSDDDDRGYKRKNDELYRDEHRPYPQGKKKKSFLGEMFDLFD